MRLLRTGARWRLFAHVDFLRDMRPIAFVDPGAFLSQLVSPGSFRDTVEPAREIRPPELVFFSFTTLTTVGYGDIVPRHGMAKSIAVLESLNRATRSAEKLM
jgi:Ion channel